MDMEENMLGTFDSFTAKGKQTIERIGRKAAIVFSKKGFASATLTDVSRAVGISKAGIYHYFSTKEELLFYVINRYMDLVLHRLKEELEAVPAPERVRFFVNRHIDLYKSNTHESYVILHEIKNLPPKYWEITRSKMKEYHKILIFAIGGLEGWSDIDPEKMKISAYTLLGMCNWIYWWYNSNGRVSPTELSDIIVRIFTGKFAH
jgi:AcrR family transcriptional regulator